MTTDGVITSVKGAFELLGMILAVAVPVLIIYIGGAFAEHEGKPHAGASTKEELMQHVTSPHIDSRPLVSKVEDIAIQNRSDIEKNQEIFLLLQTQTDKQLIAQAVKLDNILTEVRALKR